MSWFRRERDRGDERAASARVSSELGGFLVQATEGRALRSAIDAGVLALGDADGSTAETSGHERHRGKDLEEGGDE